ncbi:MAG: hypothetical protein IJ688_14655 [Treponema sp.]|nr:hypothetical protein [Treponema sp.]
MKRTKRRQSVYVNVPITDKMSYSLFAQGLLSEIPVENKEKDSLVFKFSGGSVFCLFYTFANFRRAYIVTAYLDENDGEAVTLPGIEIPLYVIFKAKGRKIDDLKHVLYILTKEDHYAPFRLKIEFWEKLAAMIEYHGSYREEVIFLYNKYAAKGRQIR